MKERLFIDNSHLLTGPLHVAFDVTNKCMARCLHCFNRSGNELPREELTDEEFINIIKQIAELKVFSICYCGGEPMLRYNQLLEATKILKQAGVVNIAMVSNGWLMTQEKVNALHDAGLNHIQISLDGSDAQTHERMRGIKGIFEKAVNAMEYVNNSGANLAVAFSPTHFNVSQFPEVVEMVSRYKRLANIRVQPLMPMGKALAGDDELFPTEDDYRVITRFIEDYNKSSKKGSFIIEWGDPIDHLRRFHDMGFAQISFAEIKSDGTLSVSAYLPLRVGDLKKHTLKEYWDAGLGRVWNIPVVKELSERVLSIGDMSLDNEEIPTTFFEDNLVLDIIDDKPFSNINKYTLSDIYRKR